MHSQYRFVALRDTKRSSLQMAADLPAETELDARRHLPGGEELQNSAGGDVRPLRLG
jgi:hypothetical protein